MRHSFNSHIWERWVSAARHPESIEGGTCQHDHEGCRECEVFWIWHRSLSNLLESQFISAHQSFGWIWVPFVGNVSRHAYCYQSETLDCEKVCLLCEGGPETDISMHLHRHKQTTLYIACIISTVDVVLQMLLYWNLIEPLLLTSRAIVADNRIRLSTCLCNMWLLQIL